MINQELHIIELKARINNMVSLMEDKLEVLKPNLSEVSVSSKQRSINSIKELLSAFICAYDNFQSVSKQLELEKQGRILDNDRLSFLSKQIINLQEENDNLKNNIEDEVTRRVELQGSRR